MATQAFEHRSVLFETKTYTLHKSLQEKILMMPLLDHNMATRRKASWFQIVVFVQASPLYVQK